MDYQINKDIAIRAALSSGIASVGSAVLFGDTGYVNVLNMNVPAYIVIGAASAAGSVVGDITHEYLLPNIPQPEKLQRAESMAVDFGASGLAATLALKAAGMGNDQILKSTVFGGVTKLGTNYIYNNVLDSEKEGFIL